MAANRLKELRTKLGWTQKELGEKAGVDNVAISLIENGKRTPVLATRKKLNKALGEDAFVFLPVNRVRELRIAKGWHQSELARLAEYSQSTVCDVENDKIACPTRLKERLIKIFGEDPFAPPKPVQSNGSYAIIGGTKFPVASMEFIAEEPFKPLQQFTVTRTPNGFSLDGADMGLIRDFLNWMFPKDPK